MTKTKVIGVSVIQRFNGTYDIGFYRQGQTKHYTREDYPVALADVVYDKALQEEMEVFPGLSAGGWHARRKE